MFWSHHRLEERFGHVPPVQRLLAAVNVARLRRWQQIEEQRALHQPGALHRFEAQVHSQNGEDGILREIFARIGPGARTFVEFGSTDGVENCTRALMETGWRGFWFEGDPAAAAGAQRVAAGRAVVTEGYLDRENIVERFVHAGVPEEPDLLVVDVDGNDFWLWQELGTRYRPRVVVAEYNPTFPPGIDWVLPYDPHHRWDRSYRYGASLDALDRLATKLGYELVGCDSNAVNAFFVRSDLAGSFDPRGGDTRQHYVAPKRHALSFGHPKRSPEDSTMAPLAPGQAADVSIAWARDGRLVSLPADTLSYPWVKVHNGSSASIGSGEPAPVHASYHWLKDGEVVVFDGLRTPLPRDVAPGRSAVFPIAVQAPEAPGAYVLRAALVQEGERWLDEPPEHVYADLQCAVA